MRSPQPQKSALKHKPNCCLKASPLELRLLKLCPNFAEARRVWMRMWGDRWVGVAEAGRSLGGCCGGWSIAKQKQRAEARARVGWAIVILELRLWWGVCGGLGWRRAIALGMSQRWSVDSDPTFDKRNSFVEG
jgi:hypothetical protein